MMTELEIFATAASSDAYIYLSLVCILGCAACALWLSGKTPVQQARPVSVTRGAY
jgi:hypothetical protein